MAFPSHAPSLFVVLRFLYDTGWQRRERWKFLRSPFQQRRRLLRSSCPVVDRDLVMRGRRIAFPQRDTRISTVFAQYVVGHINELQLVHIVVVVADDAF